VQQHATFGEAVAGWQRRLAAVESVLATWLGVQRRWQALDAIFGGGGAGGASSSSSAASAAADIRVQLPTDARRFDAVSADYQDLMRTAPETPLVLDACAPCSSSGGSGGAAGGGATSAADGRAERLAAQLAALEGIEKSLASYLETKRAAFPRFYFVAPADLLDILSKGSNPRAAAAKHLPKIFDNLHRLAWREEQGQGGGGGGGAAGVVGGGGGGNNSSSSTSSGSLSKVAVGMYSGEGEYVPFVTSTGALADQQQSNAADGCACEGPAEVWLQGVVGAMRSGVRGALARAAATYDDASPQGRAQWVLRTPAQACAVVSRTFFTSEVDEAFAALEEGQDEAMRVVLAGQQRQLAALIDVINGGAGVGAGAPSSSSSSKVGAGALALTGPPSSSPGGTTPAAAAAALALAPPPSSSSSSSSRELSANERKKLVTMCTIDVHARDVVQRLVDERCDSAGCFQWQSQMRYAAGEAVAAGAAAAAALGARSGGNGAPATALAPRPPPRSAIVSICDADIPYSYEYIGNCGCLCITPLTDRCYITLTQAQRLVLGGAPAGPAGTGKTETTKDLARALGVPCYVFNCSDQLDPRAMAQIYRGLAATGAWGCFDEFNRIRVEVLSVCSTQYKSVLDALRAKKQRFLFADGSGDDVALSPTCMAFITMNPGYPGRAELPESLKALFRPVSMVAPDLALICEVMLMAEGFQLSKALSRRFVILYRLCDDLLSKARHYDWKLRAIKTTLYVAGSMKRGAPAGWSEDRVLLRALRDFNAGKLARDDAAVFLGLLEDLFPRTLALVPPAVDSAFEAHVCKAAQGLGYKPHAGFRLKVAQLRELLTVRWSVFLLGPAGAGKSAVWRTLAAAQAAAGERTVWRAANPKAVTRDELYGYLHPQVRLWLCMRGARKRGSFLSASPCARRPLSAPRLCSHSRRPSLLNPPTPNPPNRPASGAKASSPASSATWPFPPPHPSTNGSCSTETSTQSGSSR